MSTTEPAQVPGIPPPAVDSGTVPGVHPWDQSVPIDPGTGQLVEPDRPPGTGPDQLESQGFTTRKPWATENEDAIPTNQRSAHNWEARVYTVNVNNSPIQAAGRLRGCVATVIWIPSTSPFGVMVSPDEGDIQQGAGLILNPGDSFQIESEGAVWLGIIPGNNSGGPAQIARFINPPGGGLGLSSS